MAAGPSGVLCSTERNSGGPGARHPRPREASSASNSVQTSPAFLCRDRTLKGPSSMVENEDRRGKWPLKGRVYGGAPCLPAGPARERPPRRQGNPEPGRRERRRRAVWLRGRFPDGVKLSSALLGVKYAQATRNDRTRNPRLFSFGAPPTEPANRASGACARRRSRDGRPCTRRPSGY